MDKTLTRAQKSALVRAVSEAEGWRGSFVGDPDPYMLKEFDRFISKAKEALKALGLRPKVTKE